MSIDLNRITLMGNLGKDPEFMKTKNGTSKATFTVATHEKYKSNGDPEPKEVTTWHNVVTWGAKADYVSKYFKRGDRIFIEGRQDNRSWEDFETKQMKYISEIRANDIKPIGAKREIEQELNEEGEN